MPNPKLPGRRKHHKLCAHAFDLDDFFGEVLLDKGKPKDVKGLLRHFVRKDDVVSLGTAFFDPAHPTYDTIQKLQEAFGKPNQGSFTPNEPGAHTVTLVYFDKDEHGVYRFFQVVSDEMHFMA